ncbi:replication factor A protein, partial [Trifolium pratense]
IGVVADEDWWYPACKCHKSVSPDSGAYYCGRCVKHVFQMIPRFRVKLRVTDGGGDAVFVVFDGDMQYLLGEQCATLVARAAADNAGAYPSEILGLVGTKVLFKVAKVTAPGLMDDGSFRVRRLCTDSAILACFDSLGCNPDVVSGLSIPAPLSDDNIYDGYPSLSEAGVDQLVTDLLMSPAGSSADQTGLSGPVSLDKTPVRSSSASVGCVGSIDVDDDTPISVLVPRLALKSSSSAKRKLEASFDDSGCDLSDSAPKVSKMG